MKRESLSLSHINVVVNQTDAYKIQNKIHIDEALCSYRQYDSPQILAVS